MFLNVSVLNTLNILQISKEALAPSGHYWKVVDWDIKPLYKQTTWCQWDRTLHVFDSEWMLYHWVTIFKIPYNSYVIYVLHMWPWAYRQVTSGSPYSKNLTVPYAKKVLHTLPWANRQVTRGSPYYKYLIMSYAKRLCRKLMIMRIHFHLNHGARKPLFSQYTVFTVS